MKLYIKMKPFLVSICVLFGVGALFAIWTQVPGAPALAATGLIAFLATCLWAAYEMWKHIKNDQPAKFMDLLRLVAVLIDLTMMVVTIILGLFGLMVHFHHTETGIAFVLLSSACAALIPTAIWFYVKRISVLSWNTSRFTTAF